MDESKLQEEVTRLSVENAELKREMHARELHHFETEQRAAELEELAKTYRDVIAADAKEFRELAAGLDHILDLLKEIDLATGTESKEVERLAELRSRFPE